MRLFSATVIATALTLAACTPELDTATASAPADNGAATVVDPLIGKRLVSGDTTFIINANGTMGGEVNGEPVVGVYKADAKESCSTYSSPEFLVGREFCSTPMISGNTVIFHRRDGSKSQPYTING